MQLVHILVATAIVGAVSLVGILLFFGKPTATKNLRALISLAAGTLLGLAFLDILPEAIESSAGVFEPHLISGVVLLSILFFFLFERVWHYYHCSHESHPGHNAHTEKSTAYMNLVGDGVHNLIDGFLIAAAFMLDYRIGVATTLAVVLHEIPQEVADFSILLHSGFTKMQAVLANLGVALTALLGATAFYFFGSSVESSIPIMAAIAAGNFIYLALADLIPELQHETDRKKIIWNTIWLLAGVALIYIVTQVVPHG